MWGALGWGDGASSSLITGGGKEGRKGGSEGYEVEKGSGAYFIPCPLGTVHGGSFHGCGAAPSSPRLDQNRLHHMAPSGAATAQHHHQPRGGAIVVDISVAGLGGGVSASASSSSSITGGHHYHHHSHQHNHRRAGAALSANSISAASSGGTPSIDVSRHRRTSSTSSPALLVPPPAQSGGERKTQILSRSLSGSRLNAGAPAFVPKGLQIACSTSLPGRAQVFGFRPPALVQASSSVIPVMMPPPAVTETSSGTGVVVPLVVEQILEPSPSMERGSVNAVPDGDDVLMASEQGGEIETGLGGAAGSVAQHCKSVVTEELKARIVKQVEFYFSDTNLSTDNYLLKFVKKDPEGFVPIPVVASFRKIKNLVKNHGVVTAALRNSPVLVVSEDGKKVRRAQPLPDVDPDEVQARTVVAENLPEKHSIEIIEQLFGKVGTVKMVRICSPEAANGANSTAAKHLKTDMVISNRLHALVEFESVEMAEKAVAELTDERNWRSGLRVRLLLRRQAFQSKQSYQQSYQQISHQRVRKLGLEGDYSMDEEGGSEKYGEKACDTRGADEFTGPQLHADRGDDFTGGDSLDHSSKKGRGRGRGGRTGSGCVVGRGRGLQLHHTHSGTPPQNSAYLVSETVAKPPPGPRMPDGTRGFSTGRGKPLAESTSVNFMV